VPEEEYLIPFGVANVKREGSDITLIATSSMVQVAEKAAEILAAEGISAEVIDPRTIVPLDEAALIKSVKKTSRAIVIDEGHQSYGVTSEIASRLNEKAFYHLDAPVLRMGAMDVPVPFSPALEDLTVPTPGGRGRKCPQARCRRDDRRGSMPHDVIMPALGMAQDTGLIVSWLKKPGDAVKTGDGLMEVETDKAVMEVEAVADGFLAAVSAEAGDHVPVGQVVAVIAETAEAAKNTSPSPSSSTPQDDEPTSRAESRPSPCRPAQRSSCPRSEWHRIVV
jgi:biotin carboxyl carrier protein